MPPLRERTAVGILLVLFLIGSFSGNHSHVDHKKYSKTDAFFSPMDSMIFSNNEELYIVPTWTHTNTYPAYPRPIDISDDGSTVIESAGNWLRIFNKTSNKTIWSYDTQSMILDSAVSKNGSYITISTFSGLVILFHKSSSTPVWISNCSGYVYQTDISDNGSYIVAGDSTGCIYAFTAQSNESLWRYNTSEPIVSLSVSGDGSTIFGAAVNDRIYVFDNSANETLWTREFSEKVIAVSVCKNGSMLVAGTQEGTFLFTRESNASVWVYQEEFEEIQISEDGSTIAATNSENNTNTLYLWDSSSNKTLWKYTDNLQAGPHEVSITVKQNRIYESLTFSESFFAYEETKLLLQVPEIMKTNKENTIHVQLTDADGSPLSNKYVVLSIYGADGSYSAYDLITDSFGEANYQWSPNDEGDYDIEAWYGGTSLFAETKPETIPYSSSEVIEGGGKTEGGNSPLFMLPLMLLSAVNVALEFLTFGCLAFLMAEAKLQDQTLKIRRISYPSIRLHKVNVTIWPFGRVEVTIPIPYIHTENDISLNSDTTKIEYSDAPNRESEFNIKSTAIDSNDGLVGVFDTFAKGLGGDSTVIQEAHTPSEDDYTTPPRRGNPTDLNITILTPDPGEYFHNVPEVTVRWTVDYPSDASDTGCKVNIDNGKYQEATPVGDPLLVEDGTILRVTYEVSFDALTSRSGLGDDNLDNGAHRVKIKAHADDISDRSSVVFYIFNIVPVIVGLVVFLFALFIAWAIDQIVQKLIGNYVLKNEAISRPLRAALAALTSVIGSIIIYLLIAWILDYIGMLFGTSLWLFPMLGIPIGFILSLFVFGIAIWCYMKASKAANAKVSWKQKRLKVFGAILGGCLTIFAISEVIIPIVMVGADENATDGIPDSAEIVLEFLTAVFAAGISSVFITKVIFGNYKAVGDTVKVTGENPSTAYSLAQKFVATLGVGMQLLLRTGIEMKHAQW